MVVAGHRAGVVDLDDARLLIQTHVLGVPMQAAADHRGIRRLTAYRRCWRAERALAADTLPDARYRAYADPVVGPALPSMHDEPAHPWTVASLAAGVGASRAAFARRFTELIGQPPLTYLTHWRLDLAADQLRGTDASIETIARNVGYANAFALTVAFKRVRGVPPRQHRRGPVPAAG